MLDIVREAPLGQAIRFISRNRLLRHPEERPDFKLPTQYVVLLRSGEDSKLQDHDSPQFDLDISGRNENDTALRPESHNSVDPELEMLGAVRTVASGRTVRYSNEQIRAEQMLEIERTKSLPIAPEKTLNGLVLVDWYTTDDPANPQNWSSCKKSFIVFILCSYTWTVYCAGPIYAASEIGIVQHFGISPVAVSLGLSLYILAYGVGDLLFSPLTEIPIIGRNPIYFLTFIVFWVLSFPTAIVNSFGGLLALRFWLGFFGSPALANGGATIGDMFSIIYIPYGLCWWVLSAWGGPAFGPLIGGFAAMAKG